MVNTPNKPVPPTAEGLKKLPDIKAPTAVAGVSNTRASAPDAANADKSGQNNFKLPEKVTQQEIKDGSFKYGGGRSAGNRSLNDAMQKVVDDD
jgi:hypothetical protein